MKSSTLGFALPNGGPVALIWGVSLNHTFMVLIILIGYSGLYVPSSSCSSAWLLVSWLRLHQHQEGYISGRTSTHLPTGGICFRGLSAVSYFEIRYTTGSQRHVIDSNTMGNIAGVASIEWGCAVQLMAAVSIGSNLTFTPTTGQILYVAF